MGFCIRQGKPALAGGAINAVAITSVSIRAAVNVVAFLKLKELSGLILRISFPGKVSVGSACTSKTEMKRV